MNCLQITNKENLGIAYKSKHVKYSFNRYFPAEGRCMIFELKLSANEISMDKEN